MIAFLATEKLFKIWHDGTHLTEIDIGPNPPQPLEAHWSPTWPNRIAYAKMWDYGDSTLTHVFVINTDGSGMQDLTPTGVRYASSLAWSPDGSKIAFKEYQRLMVVNADGTGLDTIATNPQLSSPAWMPDGQHILYFAGTDIERTVPNERGIWSVKYDGTGRVKIRTVPSSEGAYWRFQVSPDGNKLALCHTGSGSASLRVMDIDGTGLLTLPLQCDGSTPQWSPDGSRILTVHNFNLYTVSPDGGTLEQLTTDGAYSARYEQARWSRQGTQIAYVRGGVQNPFDGSVDFPLYVMNADGSSRQKLTPFGLDVDSPSWGPW